MKCLFTASAFVIISTSSLFAQQTADTAGLYLNQGDPFLIDQLVVTATRTPKKLKEVPVITQIITAKQIEERGLHDIQELLMQETPGINFQEVGYGTDISLQGLGAKHILFLIDGERIAGENSGNIDYQRLNLQNVERIEIVKGASSALYGSQAMGGVINIITKKAQQPLEAQLGLRYASPNQRNFETVKPDDEQRRFKLNLDRPNMVANASLAGRLGPVRASADVVRKSSDAYQLFDRVGLQKRFVQYGITVDEPTSAKPTSISGYEDLQASLRIDAQPLDALSLRGHLTYYTLNKYDFEPNNIFDQSVDWAFGGGVAYMIDTARRIEFSMHADRYSRYDKFERKDGRRLEYANNIEQPRLSYFSTALPRQELSLGLELYRESLLSDKFEANVKETKAQWYASLYAQDDYRVTNLLSIALGARADFHKEYGLTITPKLSAMLMLHPFTLRANYARGYRSPTLKELYMNWDHLGMFWIYGNTALRPETNHYISLSAEVTNRWLNISASAYTNHFRDKIEGIWAANQTELRYTNIGKSHLMGLESMAKLRIWQPLVVYASYSYLYVGKTDGVRLSTAAPHSGTVRLELSSLQKRYPTVLNIAASITGGKEFDVLDEVNIDGQEVEAYYRVNVAPYSLWNISIAQHLHRYAMLSAGVENLFNHTADRVNFNTSTSPGRSFFVACTLKW